MKNLIILFILLSIIYPIFGASISGYVCDSVTGEPLQCKIELISQDMNTLDRIETTSNEYGLYVFTNVEPNTYLVFASTLINNYFDQYYDHVANENQASQLVISNENSVFENINFSMIPVENGNGTLTGVIKNIYGEPLSGCTIKLIRNPYQYAFQLITTSASDDGSFIISNIPEGDYYLTIYGPVGYRPYFYDNTDNYYEAELIHFEGQAHHIGMNVTLYYYDMNTVSGYVIDEDSEQPIDEANVSYIVFNGEHEGCFISTTTDNSGYYELDLPDGDYRAAAFKSGYWAQYYENQSNFYDANTIEITDDISDICYELSSTGLELDNSISGNIITIDGGVPEFATMIVAVSSDEEEEWDQQETMMRADGSYEIEHLDTGSYILFAISIEAPPTYYPSVNDWQNAVPVYTQGSTPGIDIVLDPAEISGFNTMEGHVYESATVPLNTASIILKNDYGKVTGFGLTDESGYYKLYYLGTGSYSALITKPNFASLLTSVDITENIIQNYTINYYPISSPGSDPSEEVKKTTIINYPNPYCPMNGERSPVTKISFDIEQNGNVNITIYNLLGQAIRQLQDDFFKAGHYEVEWNGLDNNNISVPSGIYLYKLETNDKTYSNKLLLLK